VARDASVDSIRSAYRKLAKQHHPDLNPNDAKAEARFKEISAAHHLLSDPARRARFDSGEIDAQGQERPPRRTYRDHADSAAGRRYNPAGAGHHAGDIDDIGDLFSSLFSAGRTRPQPQGPRRGEDQHFSLTAAFLDAVNGATTRLTLPDGRILDVKIPAGAQDGATLRLRGQGQAGEMGGPAGDALIEIEITPHAFFRRDGADIRLDLPVSLAEAVLGGAIDIPTPAGPVRMRIPAGSDSLAQLRLRGRGVPAHGAKSADIAAGDLIATLRVTLGPPDPALIAFLQGWTPEIPHNPREALEHAP